MTLISWMITVVVFGFWARLLLPWFLARHKRTLNASSRALLARAPKDDALAIARTGRRTIVARRLGLGLGVAAAFAYIRFGEAYAVFLAPTIVAAGYLLGVAVGEGLMPGPQWSAVRSTNLQRRRPSDYVGRIARWSVGVVALLGVVTATVGLLLTDANGHSFTRTCSLVAGPWADIAHPPAVVWPRLGFGGSGGGTTTLRDGVWRSSFTVDPWPGSHYAWALFGSAAAAVGLAWYALRRVAGRARLSTDPVTTQLDDSLRTESSRRIVAAALAAVLIPTSSLLSGIGIVYRNVCNLGAQPFPGDYLRWTSYVLMVVAIGGRLRLSGHDATTPDTGACAPRQRRPGATVSVPDLTVDTSSPVPPYEQIRAQIAALVSGGGLRAGDRLPPVRQLAADLALAAGTVARAYKELESAGVVVTRRRTGTHIADSALPSSDAERRSALDDAARAYVAAGRTLGAADAGLRDALTRALG